MVNTGIKNVGIVTKNNYQSLMDHIGSGREWDLSRKRGGLVVLPPFSNNFFGIYRGRVEALACALTYIKGSKAKYVLVTDSDVIANINYEKAIDDHVSKNADITVMYKPGLFEYENMRDVDTICFDGKKRLTDIMINPLVTGEQNIYLDMFIINRELCEKIITDSVSHNKYSFSRDILQAKNESLNINCFEVEGYAKKISSLKTYFDASIELLGKTVRDELFPRTSPIYTKVRDEVPVRYGLKSMVSNSLIADGCKIDGEVINSIIFRGVKISRGARVHNSVIMQGTTIGENASLEYVITDKDVLIKDSRTLTGYQTYPMFISKAKIV